MITRQTILTSILLLCGSIFCHAATIDSTLYTTYTTFDNKTTLDWSVCGSLPDSSGCYASGQLGPFGQIGSIIEGAKSYNVSKGTVTRYLYVIDQATAPLRMASRSTPTREWIRLPPPTTRQHSPWKRP
jgi:hypothetical protein